MYAANHFVRIKGRMYVAGEIIPENLDEEKTAWLLEAGAIREIAPAPGKMTPPQEDPPGDEPQGDEPVDEPVEEALPEEIVEEALPEETVEEDAPEINVMDGVVAPAEEKAAKASRRRNGSKGGKG